MAGVSAVKNSKIGTASKFSVLRIDDDSSEDEEGLKGLLKSKPAKTPGAFGRQGHPLSTVSTQKKAGQSKKRGKKKPKTVPAWNRMEGDDAEDSKVKAEDGQEDAEVERAIAESKSEFDAQQQRLQAEEEENIHAAMAASKDEADNFRTDSNFHSISPEKNATFSGKSEVEIRNGENTAQTGCNGEHNFVAEIEAEAKRIMDSEAKKKGGKLPYQAKNYNSLLMQLYISKIDEVTSRFGALSEENEVLREESKKYKERYKKLCQLLKDSEVKEKVQLVVELERSTEVRDELTLQIEDLSGQLEQARSKIHHLENALKPASAVSK